MNSVLKSLWKCTSADRMLIGVLCYFSYYTPNRGITMVCYFNTLRMEGETSILASDTYLVCIPIRQEHAKHNNKMMVS